MTTTSKHPETISLHGGTYRRDESTTSVAVPIYQTTSYQFNSAEHAENLFGLKLEGYGLKRIYGFLAERYMSYWFKKYTNYKTQKIIFKDISDFNKIKEL